jgi:hypothetical protein
MDTPRPSIFQTDRFIGNYLPRPREQGTMPLYFPVLAVQ